MEDLKNVRMELKTRIEDGEQNLAIRGGKVVVFKPINKTRNEDVLVGQGGMVVVNLKKAM